MTAAASTQVGGSDMAGATKAQRVAALNRQMESVKARKAVLDAQEALKAAKAKAAQVRGRNGNGGGR